MAKGKITKRTVDAARPRPTKQIIWDDALTGFGLKVTPAGNKVYVFQYRIAAAGEASRTPPMLWTIGGHGDPWTPSTAREEALRLSVLVAQGRDPKADKQEQIVAKERARQEKAEKARIESDYRFDVVAERWLAALIPDGKSQKYHDTSRWAVRSYLNPVLGHRPLPYATAVDVQQAIDAIPRAKASTRVAVHETAFAIFRWARSSSGGRLITHNVVEDVDRPMKPDSRRRVLSDNELAHIWLAANELSPTWAAFFRLAILTGKRRSEVERMRWSELDQSAKEWLLPPDRTKNGQADLVPLSEAAVEVLDGLAAKTTGHETGQVSWPSSGYVLSNDGRTPIGNHSKTKRLLDDAVARRCEGEAIPNWVVHDFRRTLATGAQRLGVRLEVTEALLNHKGKSRSGIVAVYQLHDWKDEKHQAARDWCRHVRQIVAVAEGSNVVMLTGNRKAGQ